MGESVQFQTGPPQVKEKNPSILSQRKFQNTPLSSVQGSCQVSTSVTHTVHLVNISERQPGSAHHKQKKGSLYICICIYFF